jgi:hypothetical protein
MFLNRMKPKSNRHDKAAAADVAKQPAPRLRERAAPTLRFSPTAWAKLLFLRDLGETEVGGFGITAADDPLLVEDVKLVCQIATGVSVAFDDQAVAEFFDQQVDAGRKPSQFGRIWVHTHPGNMSRPSITDDETFDRVFGRTQWAVMFILAQGGQTFARLRYHVGPGGDLDLPVAVEYGLPFSASDHSAWQAEYLACVQPADFLEIRSPQGPGLPPAAHAVAEPWDDWFAGWDDLLRPEQAVLVEEPHAV